MVRGGDRRESGTGWRQEGEWYGVETGGRVVRGGDRRESGTGWRQERVVKGGNRRESGMGYVLGSQCAP